MRLAGTKGMGIHERNACAVILAGGKGTRLSSVYESIPKALVPVGGKPVLAHQLDLLQAQGYRDVRIFAGHLGNQILDFINTHSWDDLEINVEVETLPLGSAGGVIEKLETLPEQFTIIYGDTMVAVDLERMMAFHAEKGADITLLVHPNDHPYDSDLIEADADCLVTALHPYPHPASAYFNNTVSAALYIVNRDSLRPWAGESKPCDFAKDVFPKVLKKGGKLYAYRSHEYIKDMGTPGRLEKVEADFHSTLINAGKGKERQPVVFLDRDGTINQEAGYISKPEQLQLLPGVALAIQTIRSAGFLVVVITNQPVVARGEATEEAIAAIHRKLEWELGLQAAFVDASYYCPHHPDSGFDGERAELKIKCECRKPEPGMIMLACKQFPVAISSSWVIGDTTIDIELARRAGMQSILVHTGSAGRDGKYPNAKPTLVAADLA